MPNCSTNFRAKVFAFIIPSISSRTSRPFRHLPAGAATGTSLHLRRTAVGRGDGVRQSLVFQIDDFKKA